MKAHPLAEAILSKMTFDVKRVFHTATEVDQESLGR